MAYVPPHKRHSRDSERPAPSPASIASHFKKTLNLGGSNRGRDRRGPSQHGQKIVYAAESIFRWWPVGTPPGADPIPSSFRMEPFSCELFERGDGAKPLVLAGSREQVDGVAAEEERLWKTIVERVAPELVAATGRAMTEVEAAGEETKMSFVARVGKILFHGPSISIDSIRKAAAAETDYRNQIRKSFYTNVPNAYMEDVEHLVVPRIGFDFHSEKEHFIVKVSDECNPDSVIACKCVVAEDGGKLAIHKITLNQVRHLVVDISCLYKDLDLRLMLVTKRKLKVLSVFQDEEKDAISTLIESAVITPDVKGGLRWPLGKDSAAERFSVVGVWHIKYKVSKGQMIKLYLRHVDRFDFRSSTGEVSTEVTLKPTAIPKLLRDMAAEETGPLTMMLEKSVKLTWDHLLNYSQ